jgi:hypothetical protein
VSHAASASRGPDVRIRDGLRDTTVSWLIARVALFAISAMAVDSFRLLPAGQPTLDSGYPPPSLLPGWHVLFTATQRQDAMWMLRLATTGYAHGDSSAAFFPLYPMVVRAVAWLPGIGPLAAASIVSNAAFFGALLLLHALTRHEFGDADTARRAVLFTALFPTAFFFLAPYTESTFLLLSVAAFWFARRDRWGWAAAAGAAAALTRSIGVLLLFGLAFEAFRQHAREGRPLIPRLAGALAVLAGPVAYLVYWQLRFHDLLAPLDAQRNWQRERTAPWVTVWDALRFAWRYRTYWLVDVLVVGLAVTGVVYAIASRRLAGAYSVYAAASILLPLVFPLKDRPLLSMPRFVAVVFPLSWGFALAVSRRRIPEAAVTAGFAVGFGALAWLFVTWWPVF